MKYDYLFHAELMDRWVTAYSLNKEHKIEKGDLLTTIPVLTKEWKLSFELKAKEIEEGFQQVLHMTTGGKGAGSGAKYGDRTPAIWRHSSRGFLISSAVNGKPSFSNYIKPPSWWYYQLWVKIEVGQELVDSEMIYYISIDGIDAHPGSGRRRGRGGRRGRRGRGRRLSADYSAKNSAPSEFRDVKVYASSPWYNPMNGYIRNLVIKNKQKGRCFFRCQLVIMFIISTKQKIKHIVIMFENMSKSSNSFARRWRGLQEGKVYKVLPRRLG